MLHEIAEVMRTATFPLPLSVNCVNNEGVVDTLLPDALGSSSVHGCNDVTVI